MTVVPFPTAAAANDDKCGDRRGDRGRAPDYDHGTLLAHLLSAGVAFMDPDTDRIMVRTVDGPHALRFDEIEEVVGQFASNVS